MKSSSIKKKYILHEKYLLSKKKTIKIRKNQFNKDIPIINIIKKNKNGEVLIEKLVKYINFIITENKKKSTNILDKKNITYFDKEKIGKSGANIGFININNSNYIIKTFKFKKPKNPFNQSNNCLKLFTPYNEIIQNILVSNIVQFLNKKERVIFRRFNFADNILKLEYFGLDDNTTYIINKQVGITYESNYYTNLGELFKNHYLQLLNKTFKEEKYHIIDLFLRFLTEKLNHYFKFLRLLNKKIGYINTDLKCVNVFIKETPLNSAMLKKYKLLIDNGFILNYTLLVSDLDKSTMKINQTSFMPNEDKLLEKLLSRTNTRLSTIYHFRYNCLKDKNYCMRFKPYHFDRITLYYDIYILFYTKIYKTQKFNSLDEYYSYLGKLNNYVMKSLNIDKDEFKLFYERINNSFFIKRKPSNIKLSIHINALLYNFCRRLNSNK